jgi:hypothetical protein
MAEDTQPLTETDLAAAIQNFEFFAIRLKGVLALSDKMRQLQALIGGEREKRALLADLDQRAAAVREVVATAAAAEQRLTGLQNEIDQRLADARAEAECILAAARSTAGGTEADARAQAARILDDGRSAAAAEAQCQGREATKRGEEISRLDSEIAARRDVLADINREIEDLRARIGAR